MMRSVLLVLVALSVVAVCSAAPVHQRESIFDRPVVAAAPAPLVASSFDSSPTARFFLSTRGVDFFQSIMNTVLNSALADVALPDETLGSKHEQLTLTDIQLQGVKFDAHNLTLTAPNRVTVAFSDIQGEVDLKWQFKGRLHIHDHGTLKATLQYTSLFIELSFASDAQGRPQIELVSSNLKIDDFNIKVGGGGAWLINFIMKLVRNDLKEKIQAKMNTVISTEFTTVLAAVGAKYPLSMQVNNETELNLGLTPSAGFHIVDDYLVMDGNWYFQSTVNQSVYTPAHDALPASMPNSPMFGLAFDQFFFDSLLFSMTANGKFDFDFASPKVTTKTLAVIYPALYLEFPNGNEVTLSFDQAGGNPPVVINTANGTEIANVVDVTLNVLANDTSVPVCSLSITFTLGSDLRIDNEAAGQSFLRGTVAPLFLNVSVNWALVPVGEFAHDVLVLTRGLANHFIIPVLDKVLATGIPLPTSFGGLLMENLVLAHVDSAVAVGFDLALTTEEAKEKAAEGFMNFLDL